MISFILLVAAILVCRSVNYVIRWTLRNKLRRLVDYCLWFLKSCVFSLLTKIKLSYALCNFQKNITFILTQTCFIVVYSIERNAVKYLVGVNGIKNILNAAKNFYHWKLSMGSAILSIPYILGRNFFNFLFLLSKH